MNFNYLKKIISEKKLSTKELAEQIGMTYEGLNKAFKEESIKVATLEKICKIINVSPAIFFDGVHELNSTNVANGNEVSHLRELLAEKERLIQVLLNK